MTSENPNDTVHSNGDEMRNLIITKDWDKTPLGIPENWPQTLSTLIPVILENPLGMCIAWGTDYTQIYNDSYREILGDLKHPYALGNSIRDTYSEIWPAFSSAMDSAMNGMAVKFSDFKLVLKRKGFVENCYLDFTCSPIRMLDDKVGGVLITITESMAAKSSEDYTEEIKRENELQFTTLANNIPNLAWMANPDGWIYWYNARWFEYTGKTPAEMEGWGWKSVHDPAQLSEVLEKWEHSIKTGQPFEMVFPLKGADNIFRPFLTLVFPLRDSEGTITKWIGTNTDISKQNKAEEQFRQMAERMPQKIWIADTQGNRNYFNQTMLDYTGLTFEDLEGWGWKRIIHPDDWQRTKQRLEYSLATGEDYENENRLLRKDGKFLWHIVRSAAIKDELGNIKMWIGTNTEINDQVTLSETLEQDLKERENRIQTILQHAPDAVISIDEKGIIRSWNNEAEAIFGWTELETIGKSLTQTIIPVRYHSGHNNGMKHFLNTGEGPVINNAIEVSAIKKNGDEIPVELKISTSKIHGEYIFIGFIRDISIRKEAEETIKNKTTQLIEAQQLAHIGSWEWDVRTNIIQWSDELYRIFGLAPQEFEANYENFLKYIHDEDREYVNAIVTQAFVDHQPFRFFHKLISAEGITRVISATGKVFTDDSGETIKMTGTAQDVTEQKKYEQELKISEERFYKIFDSNPVPMTLSEIKTNKIIYANSVFYKSFGFNKEEVIGNSSEELNLIDPEEYKRVIDIIFGYIDEKRSIDQVQALSKDETETILLKLKQADQMKDFEVLYTRKNGVKFPALVSFEVIRIGVESYTVTSYQDITERKRAEEQLKIKNEQLEKANKELESFAYVSSHDLQEPLRKIQTFVSLISDRETQNLSDYGIDMFQRIESSANRMQTLIKDLLAFSSTAVQDRNYENVNLRNIVEEVKDDFSEEIFKKNAVIEFGQICDATVIQFQFRQLIFNLIGNALKFSKVDRPPHITINCAVGEGSEFNVEKLTKDRRYYHITVADNGIGFDAEHKEKIFEVFRRLHRKDDFVGTGVGLAIVKKIVDNHNGFIVADGELNVGATFHIYIPVIDTD